MKKKILSLLFALLLSVVLPTLTLATGIEDGETEEISIENTTIEYDFSHVFCGEYDVADYPGMATVHLTECVEVIALLEVAHDGAYHIYTYVYNPGKFDFDFSSSETYVQLSCQGAPAERVSCSLVDSYDDGLIYKLKLEKELVSSEPERVYHISDIELERADASHYSVAINKSYRYFEIGDVRNCAVSDNAVLELNVEHTSYRVNTEGENVYTDIQSVYFNVDNELLEQFDMFRAITVTWQEYEVPNVLIVDDEELAAQLREWVSEDGAPTEDCGFAVAFSPREFWECTPNDEELGLSFKSFGAEMYFNESIIPSTRFYPVLEEDRTFWDDLAGVFKYTITDRGEALEKLPFILYVPRESFSEDQALLVSGQEFLTQYDLSSGLYSESIELINDVLSETFTVHMNGAVERYSVNSLFAQFFFAGVEDFEETLLYNNLQAVDVNDLELSDEDFSTKYLVAVTDAAEIKAAAAQSESTTYLLRYTETQYSVNDAWVIEGEKSDVLACNAFGCNNTYIEGFDTLELTFSSVGANGEEVLTVYDVSSSPTDYISEFTGEEIAPVLPEELTSWAQSLFNSLYGTFNGVKTVLTIVFIVVIALVLIRIISGLLPRKEKK